MKHFLDNIYIALAAYRITWKSALIRCFVLVAFYATKISYYLVPVIGIAFVAFNIDNKLIPAVAVISLAYPILVHYVILPSIVRWNLNMLTKAADDMDYRFAKDIHDSIKSGEETKEQIIDALVRSGYDQGTINRIFNLVDKIDHE